MVKVKQIINITITTLVAVLFSSFGIVGHVSALSSSSHGSGMHHSNTTASNCATICLSSPVNKDRNQPEYVEQQREPKGPFYLQFVASQVAWLSEQKYSTRTDDPPEKVPKYRLCCVIRR